jgi:L-histidine N-alpha-methyltransferase
VDAEVASRVSVEVVLDAADWSGHLAAETRCGLADTPPWIPPVWFYDDVGSALFDRITRLPEYYPTRAERGILARHAAEIAETTGAQTLAELGSGTSDKTRLLLDALQGTGTLESFAPFDCSEQTLRSAAASIAAERPGLSVRAVVGDFHRHLAALPTDGVCLLAFLGSTIGNLEPVARKGFLAATAEILDDDDWFLLGTDLMKPVHRLVAAYDDAAGVTAEFNLNCLSVMNRELGADFDPGAFAHRSHWSEADSWIEMHLVARCDQRVRVEGLGGLDVELRAGDHIRTELSAKFTAEQVAAELADAGLRTEATFTDPDGDFLVSLARRATG